MCVCVCVCMYFSFVVLQIGDLYGNDVHQLELCLDYWSAGSSGEVSIMRGAHYSRVPHKQVYKYLHVMLLVIFMYIMM